MQISKINSCNNITIDMIRFARAGSRVQRYHTHGPLVPDTVGQHSHGVAMLVLAITNGEAEAPLLKGALTHDLAEHFMGDIPSPAKALMDRAKLNQTEEHLLRKVGLGNELNVWDKRILKLADILDGLFFCLEEWQRGNQMLNDVFHVYSGYFSTRIKEFRAFFDEVPRLSAYADNATALFNYVQQTKGTSHEQS